VSPENADYRIGMFSEENIKIILRLFTSWQVIAMTVTVILLFLFVNYVTRGRHRPKMARKSKSKAKARRKKLAMPKLKVRKKTKEVSEDVNSNEALGLEEA
jgi:hypothetical protein